MQNDSTLPSCLFLEELVLRLGKIAGIPLDVNLAAALDPYCQDTALRIFLFDGLQGVK